MTHSNFSDRSAKRASFFSNTVATLLVMAFIVMVSFPVMMPLASTEDVSAWMLLPFMVVLLGSSMIVMLAAQMLVLAALVGTLRGLDNNFGWCKPSECTSFGAWFASGWRFYGSKGMQTGQRLFGFEVAIQGTVK